MSQLIRVTKPTLKVLAFMRSLEGNSTWGFEIVQATELKTGTVYPILVRLESLDWVESYWEDDDRRSGPRRRLYKLSSMGKDQTKKLLAKDLVAQADAAKFASRLIQRST